MKKVLKGKCFADVEEVKQKKAEALKVIKIDVFKNCLEQWKKVSIGVLPQMESSFKVTELKHVRINTQLFEIYLLIMLLQLSHFPLPSLHSILPTPSLPHSPPYSSCPWVILTSSLASTFPILFLPSPCLFSTCHLPYLFSVPFPPLSPSQPLLITLHAISISVVLFLF